MRNCLGFRQARQSEPADCRETFYLLPLTEDLKKEWIKNLTKNVATLAIPAGKDWLFGIFAENNGNNPDQNINEQITNSKHIRVL